MSGHGRGERGTEIEDAVASEGVRWHVTLHR
jgi:hypothetical protein